jgi:hypothetical protein
MSRPPHPSAPHALERPGTDAAHVAWAARIEREQAARIEREQAARAGPPDPARLRLAAQLSEQERLLFGHVRTRWA